MYLLNANFVIELREEFAKKKKSNIGKDAAKGVVGGAVIGGTGLAAQSGGMYLYDIKSNKSGLKTAEEGLKVAKAGMRANHPDRVAKTFDNERLQKGFENIKKQKFQDYADLKSKSTEVLDSIDPKYKKSYKSLIKEDAINTGKRIKTKIGKGVSLLKANKGKTALGIGALAIGATVANKLRKSRVDKGKLRGKYSK